MNMCESSWFGGRPVLILIIFYHIWYDDTLWHHFSHFSLFGLICVESIQLKQHVIILWKKSKEWRHISQIWTYGLIIWWIERVSIWFIHHWITSINDGRHINCLSLLTWDYVMQGRFDKPTLQTWYSAIVRGTDMYDHSFCHKSPIFC